MIVVFLIWGGASDRFSDFQMPDIGAIVIGVLVVGLLVGILLTATRWGRDVVRPWLIQVRRRIRETLGELARDPKKMGQLFGGAVLGKLANITAERDG